MNQKTNVRNLLNNLPIIEQEHGEEGYALVEINENMLRQLKNVGVSKDVVEKYGDDGTTCIVSLALSEGYADAWFKGKLIDTQPYPIEDDTECFEPHSITVEDALVSIKHLAAFLYEGYQNNRDVVNTTQEIMRIIEQTTNQKQGDHN